jgi:pimeloyl-ACP methyl ester carboxylesterase
MPQLTVNGLNFHVVEEGKPNGPVVLLLHGFPDSSELWRYQIPPLVAAGYRVIAPDLRGFGRSDKPPLPVDYRLDLLVTDVLGILTQMGVGKFHLVGHDWGSALAWVLAAFLSQPMSEQFLAALPPAVARIWVAASIKPQALSLAALSVAHPGAYKQPELVQRQKSWYILFFQFDRAEAALPQHDWQLLRQWSDNHSELTRWTQDLSRPGALRAALNWYRAGAHPDHSIADDRNLPLIRVPTLGVWSSEDPHLTEAPMKGSEQFVDKPDLNWRYERIDGAGHWMQLDKPDYINKLLLDWLQKW